MNPNITSKLTSILYKYSIGSVYDFFTKPRPPILYDGKIDGELIRAKPLDDAYEKDESKEYKCRLELRVARLNKELKDIPIGDCSESKLSYKLIFIESDKYEIETATVKFRLNSGITREQAKGLYDIIHSNEDVIRYEKGTKSHPLIP